MARERLSVTLPESLIETIDDLASESGENRSQAVERLLINGLRPQSDEQGYYESMQFRGNTEELLGFLKYLVAPDSDHTFEADRYRMAKFYVKLNPGEKPVGYFHMKGSEPD